MIIPQYLENKIHLYNQSDEAFFIAGLIGLYKDMLVTVNKFVHPEIGEKEFSFNLWLHRNYFLKQPEKRRWPELDEIISMYKHHQGSRFDKGFAKYILRHQRVQNAMAKDV